MAQTGLESQAKLQAFSTELQGHARSFNDSYLTDYIALSAEKFPDYVPFSSPERDMTNVALLSWKILAQYLTTQNNPKLSTYFIAQARARNMMQQENKFQTIAKNL